MCKRKEKSKIFAVSEHATSTRGVFGYTISGPHVMHAGDCGSQPAPGGHCADPSHLYRASIDALRTEGPPGTEVRGALSADQRWLLGERIKSLSGLG
jgi:hypothetical protein